MRLLLLSNSTLPGEAYLGWPREHITSFLGEKKRIAFVPYAAVSLGMDEYRDITVRAFGQMGHDMFSLHDAADPVKALEGADAVAIGGGNSFQLLRTLYRTGLITAIGKRVKDGMPFLGWSAGSNVACPTIRTTNDMPITEPPSLRAMHLVPFQINPHYTDARLPGHGGEGRDQRIAEFHVLNPTVPVVGLCEGALLRVEGNTMTLEGNGMRLFRNGAAPRDFVGGTSLRTDLADA